MKRRSLLAAPALAAGCWLSDLTCKAADPDVKAKFVWHLPSDQLGTAKKYVGEPQSIEPEPHSATDTRGLPILLIISAVALLPQIAEAVVRVYREYKNGGVLITSKEGALQISTDRRVPANMVIVQSDKGVTIYQSKDPSADDLLSPLKNILKTEK